MRPPHRPGYAQPRNGQSRRKAAHDDNPAQDGSAVSVDLDGFRARCQSAIQHDGTMFAREALTVADELDVARHRIAALEHERDEMARAFVEPDVLAAYQATAAAVARREVWA